MNNKIKLYESPDTAEHVESLNMVQLSRDLLLAMVESTEILQGKKMTWQGLKEAQIVLGYLNAVNNQVKTRMRWFAMTNLKEKIEKVKEKNKNLEK